MVLITWKKKIKGVRFDNHWELFIKYSIFLFFPVLFIFCYFCEFSLGDLGPGFQPMFPIGSFSKILWVSEHLAYAIYKCLISLICVVTVETKSQWEPELKTTSRGWTEMQASVWKAQCLLLAVFSSRSFEWVLCSVLCLQRRHLKWWQYLSTPNTDSR